MDRDQEKSTQPCDKPEGARYKSDNLSDAKCPDAVEQFRFLWSHYVRRPKGTIS